MKPYSNDLRRRIVDAYESGAHSLTVRNAIEENNDLTLKELGRLVKGKHKKEVSLPTISRLLQAIGLARKKSRSTPAKEIHLGSSRPEAAISKEWAKWI